MSCDVRKLSHLRTIGSINEIRFPTNSEDVRDAYIYAEENGLKAFSIGGGSNTLIGHLNKVMLISDRKYEYEWEVSDDILVLSSNHNINYIIMRALQIGLGGLEFLAGIPAHLGGLVFMNAGANGRTISEFVEWIDIVNEDGEKRILRKDIDFGYRKSGISGYITRVCLRLEKGQSSEAIRAQIKHSVLNRKQKQPLSMPNLGCFFKNTEKHSAGYLIEKAGLKSYRIGGAMVSPLHANFLVNAGDAKFEDFVALIERVKGVVQRDFNVLLEEEVRIINE